MKTIIPPYLMPGDTIGMIAPAGYMPFEKMAACLTSLEEWGYTIKAGNTTNSKSDNYFSGTDEERQRDLQEMLDDKSVKAIMCARGGYGMNRIIDKINFKQFIKHPKWLIGFSDITVLHAHVFANYRIATLHAPMAAAFNDGEAGNEYVLSLKRALEGASYEYQVASHLYNREGKAKGILVGGNLALLAHVIGSRSDFSTKKKILFIEDIGEYIYNVDRMFIQLKRAGKLDKLAGLIIGRFSDMKDTERPFGQTVTELIKEHVKEYDYPVCFDFPVSHDKENYALKMGMVHSLTIRRESVRLKS